MGKNRYYTRYNGTIYNLSKIQDILDGESDEDITMSLVHEYDIEPLEAVLIEDVINFNNGEIPADLNMAIDEYRAFNEASREGKEAQLPRCNTTKYCGRMYDFSKIQDILDGKSDDSIVNTFVNEYGIGLMDAFLLENVINFNNKRIPIDFDAAIKRYYRNLRKAPSKNVEICCPYCGSASVEKRQFLPLPWASFQKYWYCKNCHSRFDL